MPDPIRTQAELMDEITRTWEALNHALENLSEMQMTALQDAQGWSVKDHLTHMIAWERSAIFLLQGKPRYEGLDVAEALYRTGSEDQINAAIQQANRDMPLSEALEQLRSTHQQLVLLLGTLSDEDLRKPYRYYLPDEPGAGQGPSAFQVVYSNSANHYAEHLPWIEAIAHQAS